MMRKIKTYEDFVNEEINWRKAATGVALGASLLGGMSSCKKSDIHPDKPSIEQSTIQSEPWPVGTDISNKIKIKLTKDSIIIENISNRDINNRLLGFAVYEKKSSETGDPADSTALLKDMIQINNLRSDAALLSSGGGKFFDIGWSGLIKRGRNSISSNKISELGLVTPTVNGITYGSIFNWLDVNNVNYNPNYYIEITLDQALGSQYTSSNIFKHTKKVDDIVKSNGRFY